MSNNDNNNTLLASNHNAVNLKEKVELLREKIITHDKLMTSASSLSDSHLVKFLHARGYDVEKSFNAFKLYVDFIANHYALFASPDDVEAVFEANLMGIIEERTPQGEAVFVGRPGKWDPCRFTYDTYTSAVILTCETAALDEATQVNGIVYILDLGGLGMKHLLSFGPFQAKRTADISETILPMRFNEIHLIHESRLAKMGFNIIKPFLSAEFKSKIFFHGSDLESLSERLGAAVGESLPKELGGRSSEARFDCSKWFKRIVAAHHTLQSLWEAHVVIQ